MRMNGATSMYVYNNNNNIIVIIIVNFYDVK